MKLYNSIQGSPQWLQERAGHFTASKCLDLFSAKSTAKYQNLINNIVFERMTGKVAKTYKSDAMLEGNRREPESRDEFVFLNGLTVEEVGFMEIDSWVGMSSDGLVGDDGLLELKNPSHTTQVGYLSLKKVPKQYYYQMQFQLMVSERFECFFFSYHPDLPEFMEIVKRDEKLIKEIQEKLSVATKEVNETINKVFDNMDKGFGIKDEVEKIKPSFV